MQDGGLARGPRGACLARVALEVLGGPQVCGSGGLAALHRVWAARLEHLATVALRQVVRLTCWAPT